MTITKAEVYLPDTLSKDDREYVYDCSIQITNIVSKALSDVGFVLLGMQVRLSSTKDFNGWFGKWYKSCGLNQDTALACMNAAKLIVRTKETDKISLFGKSFLRQLGEPGVRGRGISGTGPLLVQEALERVGTENPMGVEELKRRKQEPQNKLDTATELLETTKKELVAATELLAEVPQGSRVNTNRDYAHLIRYVYNLKARLEIVERLTDAINADEENLVGENIDEESSTTVVDPAIAKVLTEKDLALQAKDKELEQLKVELEVAQQKDEWSSEDQLTTLLRKMLPNGVKHLPLSQQVMMAGKHLEVLDQKVKDSEDVTRVTGKNLAHRVELVNLTAAQWQELSITYTAAKRVCTDESMIARAEDGIRKSWRSWIEYLPLDMVEELQQMLDNRINHQNIQTAKPELQTIDI
jgi:hypothetical protein